MNKKLVSGCILSTTLLILISIAPSIYADRDKVYLEPTSDNDAFDYYGYTPIQLVFLLINKLRYYEGIESEEDVLEIIENDAELDAIYEELASYSCGCEEDTTDRYFYIICFTLIPFMVIGLVLFMTVRGLWLFSFAWYTFEALGCSDLPY